VGYNELLSEVVVCSLLFLESDNGEPEEEVGGAWLNVDGAPGFDPLDIWCLRIRGTKGLIFDP
jgi:hypothetical protein